MAATIEVMNEIATLENWEWQCADPTVAEILNTELDPQGPSGGDPNPCQTEAVLMVSKYGGELLHSDPTISEPNKVY